MTTDSSPSESAPQQIIIRHPFWRPVVSFYAVLLWNIFKHFALIQIDWRIFSPKNVPLISHERFVTNIINCLSLALGMSAVVEANLFTARINADAFCVCPQRHSTDISSAWNWAGAPSDSYLICNFPINSTWLESLGFRLHFMTTLSLALMQELSHVM